MSWTQGWILSVGPYPSAAQDNPKSFLVTVANNGTRPVGTSSVEGLRFRFLDKRSDGYVKVACAGEGGEIVQKPRSSTMRIVGNFFSPLLPT